MSILEYAIKLSPVEEVYGIDDTDNRRMLHSNIDMEFISRKQIDTTTAEQTVEVNGVTNPLLIGTITFLYVKVLSGDVTISIDGGISYKISLVGEGDSTLLRLNDLDSSSIRFNSTSAKIIMVTG